MTMLLRGAMVIDGTGAPARALDVAVRDGRIEAVGSGLTSDYPVVNLSGLVLTPGFIDPHTHYDAQIFWDGDLTPSSWHGVTTVIMGNCGFTIAPTRPEHRETIIQTLANVEGMSVATLRAGLPWGFETFPEYLAAIDRQRKRLNVAAMIGHTALRWYVMRDEATERAATPDEITTMAALVAEAMAHGAIGFSTSLTEHVGAFGKPVPSRSAGRDEILAIARAVGASGRGAIEMVVGGAEATELVREVAQVSGRPVTWSGRVILTTEPEEREAARAAVEASTAGEAAIYPQFSCVPIVNQVMLREPQPFKAMSPGFLEILALPPEQRLALYRDPAWRARTKAALDPKWRRRLAAATVQETKVHQHIRNGPTLGELAEAAGTTPLDELLDLSIADGLETRFRVATTNTDPVVIERHLRDDRCLLGLSDAGAHVTQVCDAGYATHLLAHWVREVGALSLERAVWKLTGQPARVFGLDDRGHIAPAMAADLIAFDPATVGGQALERIHDFPGGTDRLIARSTGVHHVWVNGEAIRRDGVDIRGSAPGRRLAGCADHADPAAII